MARYDEARRKGLAMPVALELAVVNTGIGVFASACIMALAFLMPMFTDFQRDRRTWTVSAGGLFMCLLSAMLVFPALIAIPPIAIVWRAVRRSRSRPRSLDARTAVRPAALDSRLDRRSAQSARFSGAGASASIRTCSSCKAERWSRRCAFENILLRDSGTRLPGLPVRAGTDATTRPEAKAAVFPTARPGLGRRNESRPISRMIRRPSAQF